MATSSPKNSKRQKQAMLPLKQSFAKPKTFEEFVLVIPLFLFYHVGLILSPRAANGVDPATRVFGFFWGLSPVLYLIVFAALGIMYGLVLKHTRVGQKLNRARLLRVLFEALIFGVLLGPLIGLMLHKLHVLTWVQTLGPFDRVVASAGAGFYEELVFRLGGISLLSWALAGWLGVKKAKLVAVLLSALVFSGMHYLGVFADSFELGSFVFRIILGVVLGLLFLFRGFSVAAYTHFFYDVYVLCVLS